MVSDTTALQSETVANPIFTPSAGTYTSTQSVTIACATSDATIVILLMVKPIVWVMQKPLLQCVKCY